MPLHATRASVFLACVLLNLLAQAGATPFHDAELGFSFQPPSGWKKRAVAGARVAYLAPEQIGGHTPNLNLVVTTSPTPITAQAIQEGLAGIRAGIPDMRNYSEKQVRVAGATAYLLSYDGTARGQSLHAEQLVLVKANRVYTLTGGAPSSLGGRYSPIFQKVFRSVRFTK